MGAARHRLAARLVLMEWRAKRAAAPPSRISPTPGPPCSSLVPTHAYRSSRARTCAGVDRKPVEPPVFFPKPRGRGRVTRVDELLLCRPGARGARGLDLSFAFPVCFDPLADPASRTRDAYLGIAVLGRNGPTEGYS
jgi:hypothetical protein